MRYVTPEEIRTALEKAAGKGEKTYLIINILAYSGVRVSELINIRARDIGKDNTLYVAQGKGNKPRTVDIPVALTHLLQLYIKNNKTKPRELLVPYHRSSIYRMTMKLAGKNPHAFRHAFAITLAQKTKNLRYVQTQLGHASLSTTEKYLRFMSFDEEKKQLGELYSR